MSELNGVMMQYFHWYVPADGTLWEEAAARARELAQAGITAVWLPPAYKGTGGGFDVGYGVYDMYDLGEFDQKGSMRTKYGTREQYLAAVEALQDAGLQVYADAVLNHRMGGDSAEVVRPRPSPGRPHPPARRPCGRSEAYTHFHFPGRRSTLLASSGTPRHFDAVDYDARRARRAEHVYLLEGKTFDNEVALEQGNFAFLMGCDLDFQSEEVRREVTDWGKWYLDTTGVDGFRLDAVKHIAAWFFPEWLDAMEKHAGQGPLRGGRVLDARARTPCAGTSIAWAAGCRVFAVPLHYHFHYASRAARPTTCAACWMARSWRTAAPSP